MKIGFLALLALFLAACGTDFAGSYSGTESGTEGGTAFSQGISVTLTQSGSSVTGTFDAGNGNTGTISATTNGNELNPFAATNGSGNPCGSGTFSGTVTLTNGTLTGSISGTSTSCGTVSANLSLTK